MSFNSFDGANLDNRARFMAALAFGWSFGLIMVAFFFQFVVGLAPCELCLWQRWPHVVAGIIALLLMFLPYGRACLGVGWHGWAALGALTGLLNLGLAVFHSGVERKLWDGLERCSGGAINGVSAEQLLNRLQSAPVVRCDEIPWQIMGLSMANLNAIACVVLILMFLKARALAPRL